MDKRIIVFILFVSVNEIETIENGFAQLYGPIYYKRFFLFKLCFNN